MGRSYFALTSEVILLVKYNSSWIVPKMLLQLCYLSVVDLIRDLLDVICVAIFARYQVAFQEKADMIREIKELIYTT